MPALPRRHALAAISQRELQIANTYRPYYALTLVLGLMNIVIYFMISATFASTRPSGIGDAPSFFAFAAVGLILSSILYLGINGLAQRVQEEQLTGSLEALMTEPVRAGELAIGIAGVSVAIAFCRAALFLVFAVLVLSLPLENANPLGAALIAVAVVPSYMAIGIGVGAIVLLIPRSSGVAGVGALGLALLSGAVFPVTVLPPFLEQISSVLPTFYAFDGMRAALFEGGDWGVPVLILLGSGAVLLPLSLAAFGASLRRLRVRGTIGER